MLSNTNRRVSRRRHSFCSVRNCCVAVAAVVLLPAFVWWVFEVVHHVQTAHRYHSPPPPAPKQLQPQKRSLDGTDTQQRPAAAWRDNLYNLMGTAPAGSSSDCAVTCGQLPALMERYFEYLMEEMRASQANLLAHVQQNGDSEVRTRDALHTLERALVHLADIAGAGDAGEPLEERLCFDLRDCPVPDCRCPPCVCGPGTSSPMTQQQRLAGGVCPPCPTSLVKLTRSGGDSGALEEKIVALPQLRPLDNPTGMFFVVAGAESSGNRYLVSMLVAAGCVGVSGHQQPWDKPGASFSSIDQARLVKEAPSCAVIHRSFPHSNQWPNLRSLLFQVQEANYTPKVVVITRNQLAVIQSQIRASHVRDVATAEARIQRGKRQIWGYIASTNAWFLEVSYEQLAQTDYVRYIYRQLGYRGMNKDDIPLGHPPFQNANRKYVKDT